MKFLRLSKEINLIKQTQNQRGKYSRNFDKQAKPTLREGAKTDH